MIQKKSLFFIFLLSVVFLVLGCGGGGTATPVIPHSTNIVAKATADQYLVEPSSLIHLSAKESVVDANVTYKWVDMGRLSIGDQQDITWKVPEKEGNYTVTLVLNYQRPNQTSDTVTIEVKPSKPLPLLTLNDQMIKVEAFDVEDFHFDGGQIQAGNLDAYIAVDMVDRKLKLLKFPYHDGALFVGRYYDSNKSVQKEEHLRLPQSGTKSFREKLLAGEPVKIAIIGDSLLTVSSDENVSLFTWTHLLFDPNRANLQLNLPNINQITVDNYAIAGQTAEHGLSMLTKRVITPLGESVLQEQDILDEAYDLYIIGWGANGSLLYNNFSGFDKLAYLENILASLQGKNVLLLNQSPYRHLKNHLESDVPKLYDIATQFGASYVDTWSYMWEEVIMRDHDIWASDGLHWNLEGQKLYAKAIRSVLLNEHIRGEKVASGNFLYSAVAMQQLRPFFGMDPSETNGTISPIISDFGGKVKNLSIRLGHLDLYKVGVGESISYSIPSHIGLLGILADSRENNTTTLRVTIADTTSDVVLDNQTPHRESLFRLAEYVTEQPATTVKLDVLSGTLYIQGIVGFDHGE